MTEVLRRSGRGSRLVVLAAVGLALLGLLAGLVTALGSEELTSAWGVLGVAALLTGVCLVVLVPRLARTTTVTLSPEGYRVERGRTVSLDLPREELTAVRVVRDPRETRIDLSAATATVPVLPGPRWREVVCVVRGWVQAEPALATDEVTRAYLLGDGPDPAAPVPPRGPVGLVRLAVRTRDPWAPFLPDAWGEWSAWWDRRLVVARALEPGSAAGLVGRWALLLAVFVPVVLVLWVVVRLTVLVLG